MDELESRHGLPSENEVDVQHWVQDLEETFHASMYIEDTRHVAACGTIVETPVADLTEDPERFREEADTCDDCVAYLEDDNEATIPDGGEFERATELRADGGLEEIYRRETIVATDDGIAIGEDAVPEAIDDE
ncbi:hypothetical protein EL22_19970 [Halostagnicola sp. A56]|nr:hypothetical protein EL22_19970 [Halostagnicola sp. A56]